LLLQTLVKALILLRNRQQLSPTQLLPLLFRLFRVQDKALRQLVFRHITADIKNANRKQRNERLNRAVQNFMYRCVCV
jgi:protein SDA1